MKTVRVAIFTLSILAVAVMPLAICQAAGSSGDAGAVAAITKLENDAVKADLANDASFYNKLLSDDWTGGTSRGTWDTKKSILADLKDTANNKTNSETISDLKVRVHGNTAVATYKTTYDAVVHGKHYTRTVISTDIFQRQNEDWKELANHSSLVGE